MAEPGLYERLGGVYGIAAVVDHFSDQLVEKERIHENEFIKSLRARCETENGRHALLGNNDKSGRRLAGLKFLRTLWVCAVAGGPFEYTDFDEVAAMLAGSLDHFGVPQREKDEVLGAFAAHKPEVTAGSATTYERLTGRYQWWTCGGSSWPRVHDGVGLCHANEIRMPMLDRPSARIPCSAMKSGGGVT